MRGPTCTRGREGVFGKQINRCLGSKIDQSILSSCPPHPQGQPAHAELFFFLSRRIFTITAATITSKTNPVIIVPILFDKNINIHSSLLPSPYYLLPVTCYLFPLLPNRRTEQHIQKSRSQKKRYNRSDSKMTRKQHSKLINTQ